MRTAVVGLGSMGKRRIRLLKQYIEKEVRENRSTWSIIGVDTRADRREEVRKTYEIDTTDDLSEALKQCDAVVISTSPLSHAAIIRKCLEAGKHVFTELNLVPDGYDENIALAEKAGKVLFLSSTFLYRKDVRYLIDRVNSQKMPVNYTYHIGQYLPDWHPWEKVNEYFIGDKRTNGCREIMAIEFPWLTAAFGRLRSVKVLKSRNTKLSIDYDNNYLLLMEHESEDGTIHRGTVAVDVMSRKAVRNLEIFNEEIYLSWNGSPDGLKEYLPAEKKEESISFYENVERREGYSSFIIENGYYSELKAFIEQAAYAKEPALYGFEEDKTTLAWIDRIEGSV